MADGLLLIDKIADCTSHDVVQQVRRILRQRKVGHCGTLDPGATGLLVTTLGKATRLTRFLISAPKVYVGEIAFGRATDTYDRFGETISESPIGDLDDESLQRAMSRFAGPQEQVAPPYSAKKLKGVKYYEMARRGEEVPEARKQITVFEFQATAPLSDGRLAFRLGCTSGTYVRSLAHDLGQALGCGAHLAELRRTRVGPFDVADAVSVEDLRDRSGGNLAGRGWVALDDIPLPFSVVAADAQQERRIAHGQTVLVRRMDCAEGDWIKLTNQRRRLIAVGTVVERIGDAGVGVVQPRIVFS